MMIGSPMFCPPFWEAPGVGPERPARRPACYAGPLRPSAHFLQAIEKPKGSELENGVTGPRTRARRAARATSGSHQRVR